MLVNAARAVSTTPNIHLLFFISVFSFEIDLTNQVQVLRPAGSSQCGIHNRQTVGAANEIDVRNAEQLAQLVVRHFHRPRRICLARLRLWESGRTRGVKRHVPLHLLHGLVDVTVENGYRTKSLQIGERLLAIVGAPAPLRIHGPQRNVCKQDDRCAALQPGNILFEPFELLVPQRAKPAGLQIHDIHEPDKMDSVAIEAMPAVTPRALAESLAEHRSVVVEYVVFSRNIKDALCLKALERLGKSVELLWLGEMGKVNGVQNEGRGVRT